MSQSERIKRNSLFAFLTQLIRLVANFLLFVGVARFYGVEAFGQFTTAHTLSVIFLLFADFGFDSLLLTEIGRNCNNVATVARQYFSIKMILICGAAASMMVLPLLRESSAGTAILIEIFSLYVVFSSLNNFFFGLFKGLEEFHYETKISFWTNLLSLLFLIIFGWLHAPIYFIALSFVGVRIIGVVKGMQIARHLIGRSIFYADFNHWGAHWRRVSTFGVHFVFGSLFFQIDTILLSFWRGDREVGIYQAAFKIVLLALIIPDIAINTLMPVFSRLKEENVSQWNSIGRLLFKSLFLLSLPISLLLFLYADQITKLVYGVNVFDESVPILQIFAFTVFVRFAVETFALMLTTSGRQLHRMVIVVGGTFLNVILNVFFISKYGPWGAALVSLMTNLFVGVGYLAISKVSLTEWMFDWRIAVPFIMTCIFFFGGTSFSAIPLTWVIPGLILVYVPIFYFIGYTKEERQLVFEGNMRLVFLDSFNRRS